MDYPFDQCVINLWCLDDVLKHHGWRCGCPECCAKNGMTAVFKVEDFQPGVYPLHWWPKSICSEKLALLCKERICPGWPGGAALEEKRRVGRVTVDEEERCTGWSPTAPK